MAQSMVALAQMIARLGEPMDGGAGTVPPPAAVSTDKIPARWSASEDGEIPVIPVAPLPDFSFLKRLNATHLNQSGALPQTFPRWNPLLPASPRPTAPPGLSAAVSGPKCSSP